MAIKWRTVLWSKNNERRPVAGGRCAIPHRLIPEVDTTDCKMVGFGRSQIWIFPIPLPGCVQCCLNEKTTKTKKI